ncbi:hypothetical protein DFH09DRAFT_1363759 [Mycena vulgaris]|nr:hypothetical protein DFH09DRAFT_1363759 [Mycena vulgaris]
MLVGIAAPAPSHLPAALSSSRTPRTRSPSRRPRRARAGPESSERDTAYAIFPVHAVMLAAHCAKLPRLPPSARAGSSRTASATLPPHTFMYPPPRPRPRLPTPAFFSSSSSHSAPRSSRGEELTHQTLLATLASPPALHALASRLCASAFSNLSTLMGHAVHVKEV